MPERQVRYKPQQTQREHQRQHDIDPQVCNRRVGAHPNQQRYRCRQSSLAHADLHEVAPEELTTSECNRDPNVNVQVHLLAVSSNGANCPHEVYARIKHKVLPWWLAHPHFIPTPNFREKRRNTNESAYASSTVKAR